MQKEFDVVIIGGGVVGSAVARELSRYQWKIGVLEKETDVCCGVSGRNTGLLHSGILQSPGTLSAECCMEGNAEFETVAEELDVPFERCGKLIVGYAEEERERLNRLFAQGAANQVPGIRIIGKEELRELEPEAEGEYAIWVPTAGILCPFTYTIALAENAAMNGAQYFFDREVTDIQYEEGWYRIQTNHEEFVSRRVVNCAGLYSYKISEMLGFRSYIPNRTKGEYVILDKRVGEKLNHPIYPVPNEAGACDVHVTLTIDGNVLVGPTLEPIGAKEDFDYDVKQCMIDSLGEMGAKMFSYVKRENYIRNYAGVFPALQDPDTKGTLDFQIQTDEGHPGAVNLVGITSPGLTSALPLARRVVEKIKEKEELCEKENFNPRRKGIVKFREQDARTQAKLIEENPEYGEIFCRCECVTKAEIKQAIHNILGVDTVSGVKYRTRATMGRCQGGYCETRIAAALQEELQKDRTEIRLNKKGSYMFTGEVKADEKA